LDNDVFRETYHAINERFCPYEKSILTNNCRCGEAHKFCIAEREGVHCRSDEAQAQCLDLLETLRVRARFALKATDGAAALPHAKAMRVQVGGLRGLVAALEPEKPVPAKIDDIHEVVRAAVGRFGSFTQLPFQVIIQHIAAYKGRKRLRGRR